MFNLYYQALSHPPLCVSVFVELIHSRMIYFNRYASAWNSLLSFVIESKYVAALNIILELLI